MFADRRWKCAVKSRGGRAPAVLSTAAPKTAELGHPAVDEMYRWRIMSISHDPGPVRRNAAPLRDVLSLNSSEAHRVEQD